TGRHRLEVRRRGDVAQARRPHFEVLVGEDRLQRNQDAAADRGGVLQLQLLQRREQVVAVAGRRLDQRRAAREGDEPDARGARLLRDELARRRLRRLDARGLHVRGAHAAGDVDREDHGLVARRQRDHRGGARDRGDHRAEREEQHRRRQMAAPPEVFSHRFLDQRQAGEPDGLALLAPRHQEIKRHARRQCGEEPERFGGKKAHAQKGGVPAAAAAVSTGTAKPIPANPPPPGSSIAVTMPTTSPAALRSGPPEEPGFTAASNWIRSERMRSPFVARYSRLRPDTTPDVTDGPMPKGKPTATTVSPGRRFAAGRTVAAARSSGTVCACSTARSLSGCWLTIVASDSSPSANTTRTRPAPATTCRLVRIVPLSTITTPLPEDFCR